MTMFREVFWPLVEPAHALASWFFIAVGLALFVVPWLLRHRRRPK